MNTKELYEILGKPEGYYTEKGEEELIDLLEKLQTLLEDNSNILKLSLEKLETGHSYEIIDMLQYILKR